MSSIENKQMSEREKAVVDQFRLKTGQVKKIDLLKDSAFSALRQAEKRMHNYASELEIGDERVEAFQVYENIRNAARINKT